MTVRNAAAVSDTSPHTCRFAPNPMVGAVYSKAMPVILHPQDYPKERGIRRITHITRPRGMALDGGPPIYIFRVADPSGDAP